MRPRKDQSSLVSKQDGPDLYLKICYNWGSVRVNKMTAVSWVSSVFLLCSRYSGGKALKYQCPVVLLGEMVEGMFDVAE